MAKKKGKSLQFEVGEIVYRKFDEELGQVLMAEGDFLWVQTSAQHAKKYLPKELGKLEEFKTELPLDND